MQTETTNVIQLTEERLRELLSQTAKLAAHQALRLAGLPVRDLYTRAELKRRYGSREVNDILSANLLTPHQLPATDGSRSKRIRYSETELLSLIQ